MTAVLSNPKAGSETWHASTHIYIYTYIYIYIYIYIYTCNVVIYNVIYMRNNRDNNKPQEYQ